MIFLLCVVIFLSTVSAQTLVGKVSVVGSDDSTLYSFNENFVSGLEVDVRVFVVDGSGDEVVSPVTLAVNVTCELSPSGNGYTDVSFNTIQHTLGVDFNDTIAFSIVSAGRQTHVLCWGEATSTDPTAPVFTKDTSVGDTGQLLIRPAGDVSVCTAVTIVTLTTDNQPSILVELSEAVENGNVTVVCSSDVSGIVDPIVVTFIDKVMLSGEHRTEVSYSVTALGNPVYVSCYAESSPNPGVDNVQFYRDNSTGLNTTFVQESVTVEIVPLLQQIRTTQMTAFLILSEPAVTSVEFTCDIYVSENLDLAKELSVIEGCVGGDILPDDELSTVVSVTTDIHMETVSATQAPSTNATGDWLLRDSVIVFGETDYHQPIEIYRQGENLHTQPYRPEVVFVRCCSPGVANTQLYDNQSASFAVVVYLDSNYSTNWEDATDPVNRTVETELINPAYVEIAPCPCDLTEGSCDIGCCCDELCTDEDKETFTCIPGIQGGEEFDETPRHLCTADYFNMADWSPIMCVMIENSGFLGYFRQPEGAIRSSSDLTERLRQYSGEFSYRQAETPFPLEEGAREAGYKDGLSLKTAVQQQKVTEELTFGPNYRLVLPGPSTSGQCVFSDPVAFLKDTTDSCVWEMSETFCSLASPLNALNFALPSNDGVPGCRKGLLLLSQQEVSEVAVTDVHYHCADQEYLDQHYLKSLDTAAQRLPTDQVKLFASGLPNNGEDCGFDDITGAYICGNLTIGEDTPALDLPPRCDWDNGYRAAPTPSLDNSTDISVCLDSVVEVRYNFTWNGPGVVLLNASVVIGNVALQQEKVENTTITSVVGNETVTETVSNTTRVTTQLTQLTHVEWHHQINESLYPDYQAQNEDAETENASVIFPRTSEVYQRSGKIGYELDLPVWSGISVNDTTNNQFLYMDSSLSSQLSLWKPGADSLCEGADREFVRFRENGLGSCVLRLGLSELLDCDDLRRLVLNKQDELMLSNYIGQSGDPDPENLEDWIQILRQDVSDIIVETEPDATTSTPATTAATTSATTAATTPAATAATTSAATPTTPEVNINDTYWDNLVGRCGNIPSHINVDIMYAEVGLNNGIPLHQIIGARVSYQLTTWSLYCTAADGAGCLGDTSWLEEVASGREYVQSFVLSSSVNFIEGPARTPDRKTKYKEETSKNYFLCKSDTCWEEAFYPFREGFEGDTYQYTLPVSLASLVFVIAVFAVSRPWW